MARAKRAWKIWTTVIVAMIAVAALLYWPSLSQVMHPVPEIGRNLPGNQEERSRVFQQRLQERFPVGSSATAMADALTAQGFELTSEQTDGQVWAKFVVHELVCKSQWLIVWQKGAKDDVVSIKASFGQMCV